MSPKQLFAVLVTLLPISLSPYAHAQQAGIAMAIEEHAQLTETGAMLISIRITCGPFQGVEDFQQAFAGGGQATTGAEAEGGIDGTVVCDGVERTHTARLSSFSGARFRRGPAGANASLIVCMLVGEEQTCFNGGTQRRVIIRGPVIP
jgi:hypothetical protein